MKRFIVVVLMVLSLTAAAQKKVAVYVTGNDPVNDIVGSHLVDGLAHNGKYTAVERTASFLNAMSKEHKYERDGSVDDDEIAKLGKQFSVQYVCVASVHNVWKKDKYITARIIDVETAEVVASGSSTGLVVTSADLVNAMKGLSSSLLKTLDYNKNKDAKKVAVYVTQTGNHDIDLILGDQLVAGFARSGKYVAIERTQGFLTQLSKEQGYQYSGAVDDDDLTRLGKQFGVQYVCVSKATTWAGDYFISSRLIDVSTAEVINTYNVEGVKLYDSKSVLNIASKIADKLSGKTIKEEVADANKQSLVGRPWRDLLKEVTTNVTKRYSDGGCYIGSDNFRMKVYKNGSIHCGGFDDDGNKSGSAMHITGDGYRISECPGGWVYVGSYKDGQKHDNNGIIYNREGKVIYKGKFRKDKPVGTYPADCSGLSAYTFDVVDLSTGDKYIGERKNGKYDGKGLYIWKSGAAWYGNWENGKRNGYGIKMNYDGTYSIGTWKNDKKID